MENPTFSFNIISTEDSVEVVELVLDVGCVIPAHKAFWATTFYIAQGEVEFTSKGECISLKKGDSTILEPGVVRSSKNIGSQKAVIVVVKSGELSKAPIFI